MLVTFSAAKMSATKALAARTASLTSILDCMGSLMAFSLSCREPRKRRFSWPVGASFVHSDHIIARLIAGIHPRFGLQRGPRRGFARLAMSPSIIATLFAIRPLSDRDALPERRVAHHQPELVHLQLGGEGAAAALVAHAALVEAGV